MVSKSINSDTTSTSGHLSLFLPVPFNAFAPSNGSTSIMNILFWCDNFKILNTVICFVLVLMIDLHTLWNRTNMSHAEIKRIESRSGELTLVMKHAGTYRQLKPLYDRYRKSNDKEKFLRGHESEIILFEAAARELKRLGTVPLPTTESMKTELANLNAEKERLLAEYKAARAEAQEYETVKQNVDALLTVAKEQEQQRRHELE